MGRLVDDLLDARQARRGPPARQAPGRPDPAARRRRRATPAPSTRSRPIAVEHDGALVGDGDEDRLRQVVANVVGNALVHTPPGTPIELRARRDGADAVVEVADDGPGMPPGGGGAGHRALLPRRSRRARATAAAAGSGCRSSTPRSPPTAARSTSRATSAAARSCACASRWRRPDHRPMGENRTVRSCFRPSVADRGGSAGDRHRALAGDADEVAHPDAHGDRPVAGLGDVGDHLILAGTG